MAQEGAAITLTPADLAAMRAEVERGDPPTPGQVMALVDEIARLQAALEESDEALRQSVSVQSHYAGLLNMHDGGKRIVFDNAEQWVNRLRAIHVANELRKDRP